jgi:SAM-dependent methyltransferase
MNRYLQDNAAYWSTGYEAENVDHPVFRFYGRILVPDFGLDGAGHERVLDFGCGQGAAVEFFARKGFDAYGVDIAEIDLERARDRYPAIADSFARIDPKPKPDDVFFGGDFDVILSVQTLYYLSEDDLDVRLASLYDQLAPGGVFYATMIGTRSYFYEHSKPADGGLREIEFETPRLQVSQYFVNFTESEEQLKQRFRMFRPVHVGFYSQKFRSDEGAQFHYTFVGVKEG